MTEQGSPPPAPVPAEQRPFLSIITPSYQYGRFIADAIASVRCQFRTDVEHIVVDAASTDETLSVLRSSPSVRWVSEPDDGQSDAINKGVRMASGDWVAWLNADEFYLAGALTAIIEAIERSDADVIYGDGAWVDEGGRGLELVPSYRATRWMLRNFNPFILSCACFFRRDLLVANPLATDLRLVMDWDLFLRLDKDGARFRHVSHTIGASRVHDARATAVGQERFDVEYDRIRDREGIKRTLWQTRTLFALARANHWSTQIASGNAKRKLDFRRTLRGQDLRWFAGPEHSGGTG